MGANDFVRNKVKHLIIAVEMKYELWLKISLGDH